jgi:hypothetical protein
MRSMELFGTKVAPLVRAAVTGPAANHRPAAGA